jgi:hypothetical protein
MKVGTLLLSPRGTLVLFPAGHICCTLPDYPKPINSGTARKEIVVGSEPMPREFFDPTPDEQVTVLVEHKTIRNAEGLIRSCEHCNPDGAEWPFNAVLDRVTSSDPSVTDYVLESPTKCLNCKRDIFGKTLVETQ